MTFEQWRRSQHAYTPKYYNDPKRVDALAAINRHARLDQPVDVPVCVLQGPLGSGKTRFVHEALVAEDALVLYVPDRGLVFALVSSLLNSGRGSTILVVDRCTSKDALNLTQVLAGAAGRIRCIAILESGESWPGPSVKLPSMDAAAIEAIIEANFQRTSWQHRSTISRLVGGLPGLAVKLAKLGGLNAVATAAWEVAGLLDMLVEDDGDRAALECLSLLGRVGYAGTPGHELLSLAETLGLSAPDLLARVRRLARTTDLVVVGHRYVCVRPPMFCRALLERAWRRWDRLEPKMFPESLLCRVLEQVAEHGSDEIREKVSNWGARWLGTSPVAVSDKAQMCRVIPLLEIDPPRFLPLLKDAVDRLDAVAVQQMYRGDCETPRSDLIHVLEALGSHASNYPFVEPILFSIALGESDGSARPRGRVAEIWAESFRVWLSGTATSFGERFATLSRRLDEVVPMSLPLLAFAIRRGLDWSPSKSVVPMGTVAGGLRPPDWQPADNVELRSCTASFVAALGRLILRPDANELVLEILSSRTRALLARGFLPELQAILAPAIANDDVRVTVLSAINDFLHYDCNADSEAVRINAEFVREWKTRFEFGDFRSRLLAHVGAHPYSQRLNAPEMWLETLRGFVGELFELPAMVQRSHVSWLLSLRRPFSGQFDLGASLGAHDAEGKLAEHVFARATSATNVLVLRGYVVGLGCSSTENMALVRGLLEGLESAAPLVSFDLSVHVLPAIEVVERAERLVNSGRLAIGNLKGIGSSKQPEALVRLVHLALSAPGTSHQDRVDVALDLLGHLSVPSLRNEAFEKPEVVGALWRTLEAGLEGVGAEAYYWGKLLEQLMDEDLERAASIASNGLFSEDYSVRDESTKSLMCAIGKDPKSVLALVGPVLLSDRAESLYWDRKGGLIAAFPEDVIKDWLENAGLPAARAIAPHLAPPFVDTKGERVVPTLTAFVLERFETDDIVYERFAEVASSRKIYVGDIARQHDDEAAVAKAFANYPLRRIRQWAESERTWKAAGAQSWREIDEERGWG
ncbi:MAG TPA: hypothetical protein VJV79_07550 [Polyangiaceae bacterium]|nr:hypothetical protein [Polyangiaceae bacterium]